jgi:hypothetical protein
LILWSSSTDQPNSKRVKSNSVELDKIKDDDLLIYSITALEFSLNDKFWDETYIYIDTVILKLIRRYKRIYNRRY